MTVTGQTLPPMSNIVTRPRSSGSSGPASSQPRHLVHGLGVTPRFIIMAEPVTVFPFPFPPYPIQQRFMEDVHGTIVAGKCGVFESPTGTVRTR